MKRRKRIRIIFLVLMAAVLFFVGRAAVKQFREDYTAGKSFNEIKREAEKKAEKDMLAELKKRNSDVIGYLEIPDTAIRYPVMQTKDNPDYYLNRNIDKNYSFYGTPYLSAYCDLEKSDNLIIYGHNINGGRMFGALTQYREESFYQKHKHIYFTTDSKDKYEIFAVVSVNKYIFPYWKFVMAADETDYDNFVSKAKSYSLYDTGISPEYGDKILTLSTCDNSRGNDYRFVVLGVRK